VIRSPSDSGKQRVPAKLRSPWRTSTIAECSGRVSVVPRLNSLFDFALSPFCATARPVRRKLGLGRPFAQPIHVGCLFRQSTLRVGLDLVAWLLGCLDMSHDVRSEMLHGSPKWSPSYIRQGALRASEIAVRIGSIHAPTQREPLSLSSAASTIAGVSRIRLQPALPGRCHS
jgi:hypothetical protein